ncbi:MAG: IclR family transcriptional regulator [Pseudomonadota bacterium]
MKQIQTSITASGAQTVDRACVLLKEVARAGTNGARILDLCQATDLSRPTAHRILQSLVAAGFLRQQAETRRYLLGTGLFEIGLAAPSPVDAYPEVTRLLDELARATEDTVYLMIRSHDDVFCAWRAVGAFPIKANIVSPGDRRPMAASAAGLCLLAAMPEAEASLVMKRSRPYLPQHCKPPFNDLLKLIETTRQTGYAFGYNLVMEGVTGVGMAVPSRAVQPYLAISISGISSRITAERLPSLVSALEQTTLRIAAIVDRDGKVS